MFVHSVILVLIFFVDHYFHIYKTLLFEYDRDLHIPNSTLKHSVVVTLNNAKLVRFQTFGTSDFTLRHPIH